MKLFSLITFLTLVGCSGAEFTAEKTIGNNAAGDDSKSEAGEAGETNSGGVDSGGSSTKAGSSTGGSTSAGNDAGGTPSAGSSVGGSDVGGKPSAGSAGQGGSAAGSSGSSGSAGSALSCEPSMLGGVCTGKKYDSNGTLLNADKAWSCPETTDAPPNYLEFNKSSRIRGCTESTFGSPNTLWCCTS